MFCRVFKLRLIDYKCWTAYELTADSLRLNDFNFIHWTDQELLDDLDSPVVIAAFEGWNDAGEAASSALRYFQNALALKKSEVLNQKNSSISHFSSCDSNS